jgi:hypothetical protein
MVPQFYPETPRKQKPMVNKEVTDNLERSQVESADKTSEK